MNKTTAIFLANDAVRCISVAYDADTRYDGKKVPKDKKSFKTLDASIAVDDLVIVPTDTRWGFTIGRVCEVDLHVDFDSPEQMRWIASKFDPSGYEKILEEETKMMDRVADADREHRKNELRAKLTAHGPDLSGISLVDFSTINSTPRSGFEPDKRGGAQSDYDLTTTYSEDTPL